MDFSYTQKEKDNFQIYLLKGGIDSNSMAKFEKLITSIPLNKDIIINLSKLYYISSRGLGLLWELESRVKGTDYSIYLCEINDELYNIMELTGIINLIKVFRKEDDIFSKDSIKKIIRISEEKNTVLCICREESLRNIIKFNLEHINFNVISTDKGETAFNILDTNKADIIITDLELEGLTGFDILKKIRSRRETKFLPVIVLTNETDSSILLKALSSGANECITKPFDIIELIAKLNHYIKAAKEQKKIYYKNIVNDSIIESSLYGVIVIDSLGKIIRINKKGIRIFCRENIQKAEGIKYSIVVKDIFKETFDKLIISICVDNDKTLKETEIKYDDNNILISSSPLLDRSGNIAGVIFSAL